MKKIRKYWAPEDLEMLLSNFLTVDKEALLSVLQNRTWAAILSTGRRLGMKRSFYLGNKNRRVSTLANLLTGTPEAWYWLGFLWADGNLYRPEHGKSYKLQLCITDRKHLSKFADFIEFKGTIAIELPRQENYKTQYRISVGDSEVCPLLANKYGLAERKTYNPPSLPTQLSNDQLDSLIAGFIDGDGSIVKIGQSCSASLRIECHISWYEMLNFFSHRIYELAGIQQQTRVLTKVPKGFSVDKSAKLEISIFPVLRSLKKRVLDMRLPILSHKWDRINEFAEYTPWRETKFHALQNS